MSDYEPLSPIDIERKLRQCVTDLTNAEKQLRDTRDTELAAEMEYRRQYRRAILSSDCPKVARGGVSAAERDAWVEEQCEHAYETYRLRHVQREAAADHLRSVRDTATAAQTIAGLVKQAFQIAGTS